MGYLLSAVNSILGQIHAIAPDLTIIRTDRLAETEFLECRDEVVLEAGTRKVSVERSLVPSSIDASVRKISKTHSISRQAAGELVKLTYELGLLNPRGHWVLGQPTEESEQQHPTIAAEQVQHPLFSDVVEDLREALPDCSEIIARSVRQGMAAGHVKRRVFLRLMGHDGHELAALDAAHLAAHIESVMTGIGHHALRNQQRARGWAFQLGMAPEEIAAVMHDLLLVFAHLPVERLALNSAPIAEAGKSAA